MNAVNCSWQKYICLYHYCKKYLKIPSYDPKLRVGLDSSSLIYRFHGNFDKIYEFLEPILQNKLLFVLDGKAPEYKKEEINIRKQAKEVSNDIRQWAEKKGFDVVKQTVSNDGRSGYFYFRLGRDPEKESQRIQGYFSSKLELKAFKFKVRGEQEQPAPETPQPTQPIPTKKPLRKI